MPPTMRQMQSDALNTPLRMANTARPTAKAGEILLRVQAVALNFADILLLAGKYQEKPGWPLVPGMEVVGEIVALGSEELPFEVGMRVVGFCGKGGFAQYVAIDARHCCPLADHQDETAAALPITYGTAHLALASRAGLAEGETLLVTGAGGGAGLSAVHIGKNIGAHVIAIARGTQKLEMARQAGADLSLDSEDDKLVETLKAAGGVDVLYDIVGGDLFTQLLRSMRPLGRILPIGFASGEVPQIPANHLLVKNLSVIGLYWGGYIKFAPQQFQSSLQSVVAMAAKGEISTNVTHQMPLAAANEALDLLRTRKSSGKILLLPE